MNTHRLQQGVGLIEVLIAAVVFAVGIAAVVQLQGVFFKSSGASNARAIATSIAEEKLEDLRGFSNDPNFNFASIAGDGAGANAETGGRCATLGPCVLALPAGNVTQDNITFARTWSVANYYYNAGALTTVANGDVVQKLVTVTVNWTDVDNSPQTLSLNSVINQFSGASTTGLVANNIGGSGEKPIVSYTPSTDNRVTPIGVGTDSKRETLVPTSQIVGGYTRTSFTAYTYNSANKLIREEEYQNVACDCRFDGTSTDANKTYAVTHPAWSNTQATYVDAEGEKVSGKAKGCVQGGGNNCAANPDELCNICCRDHHDIAAVSRKYDPYRSSDDFTAGGDHKHYLGNSAVTEGRYLEACRLKRVNGYWRVYQDWHMVDLTVLPLSDLIDDNPNPPPAKIKDIYAGYVKDIVDQHLEEEKVSGEVLASPPAKPAILDHTAANNQVNMSVGDKRDLTARAIYLDYVDAAHLTKVKEKMDAGVDYLVHLPFYEIEVAQVAGWNSADVAKVMVGPHDEGGFDNDLYGGQLHALANTVNAVDVTGAIRKSNSGIVALSLAVDYGAATNPDHETHGDFVKVCVGCAGGSCPLPWGGAALNNAAVTAYQAATVPAGSNCVSEQRICQNGVLSGTFQNQACSATANCTFNGVAVLNGASVTAYEAATVPAGSNCVSEQRTCQDGVLSGNYQNSNCVVNPPANCTFNGQVVSHGNPVTAYEAGVVESLDECESETRTCNDGVLSGSYTFANCVVPTCNTTVSGKKRANDTYSMRINGGAAIACPVAGNNYTCPQQTVNVSNTTIVITSSSGATHTFVSPNACGALTANF